MRAALMISRRLPAALFSLFLGLLAAFSPAPGHCAEIKATPRVGLRETYDTNLFMKNVEDLEHHLTPGLEVSSRTEKGTILVSGDLDVFRYMEHTNFDRENQNYKLKTQYFLTPAWSLGLQSGFSIDHSMDIVLDETGILVEKNRRMASSVAPSLRWAVDETNALELRPAFSRTYDSNANNADYSVSGGDFIWSHAVQDGKMIFAGIGDQNVHFDLASGSGDQDTKQALIGYSQRFTEQLAATVKGGPTWTASEFTLPGREIDESSHGYALDGQVSWTLEQGQLTLEINRGQAQSVFGENITRNSARANAISDLSERWKVGVSYTYLTSETEGLIRRSETTSQIFNPFLRYAISDDVALSLGWQYRGNRNEMDDSYRMGNRYYMMFTILFPQTY